MARRSKPHITQFFNRDRLAFIAMFRTGHVSHEHLRSCGLVDSRIKNLIRDGHIEKISYRQGNQIKECYKLTKLGRETASRNWGLSQAYHAQSPAHDLAIAEKYFSLPIEIRDHWKTESQIRDLFIEKLNDMRNQGHEDEAKLYEDMFAKGLISVPDATYLSESGQTIAFEVITNSYGQEELRSKEALVEIMSYQYETIRI